MLEYYEDFVSSILRTRNSKKPLRMLERNWQHQWIQPRFVKRARNVSMERPVARPMSSNQNLRVSWKPVNPQDWVLENLYRIIMKALHEKETIHYSTTIWFTHWFICLKPSKIQQKRQQWTRNGKLGEKLAWNLTKVRSKKEVIEEARTSGAKVHFPSKMDMSFEECWMGGKTPKMQRSSCTPRWYCKRWFRLLRTVHWTRIVSVTNSKSHGYHLQIARMRRTSSGRSICLYSGKWRIHPNYWKFQNSECPDIWIRPPKHKWTKTWSAMEDPVAPLERNLYGYPLAGVLWERQFDKVLF